MCGDGVHNKASLVLAFNNNAYLETPKSELPSYLPRNGSLNLLNYIMVLYSVQSFINVTNVQMMVIFFREMSFLHIVCNAQKCKTWSALFSKKYSIFFLQIFFIVTMVTKLTFYHWDFHEKNTSMAKSP